MKWLARIPGAPQFFDAMMLGATAVFSPRRLRAISTIEATVSGWPGVRVGIHRLGGIGFFFRGRESSHLHGNGLLDCFVGRGNRDRLIARDEARPHHVFSNSGWISFWVEDEGDIEAALRLIRIAGGE